MTLCAVECGVAGECLGPGDFPVAGATFLWHARGYGSVGIVASDAGLYWVVCYRINLGKPSRPGRVIAMAKGTITPLSRGWRFVFERRFNVGDCRTVAYFTGYRFVTGPVVYLYNVRVAGGAFLVACISQWERGIRLDGCCPVMAQLPKCLRDQIVTSHKQETY